MSITLTGEQIKDLAEFAGFFVDTYDDPDLLKTEIYITDSLNEGITNEDDGKIRYYSHVAMLNEYPEEGCYPLGKEIKK